MTLKNVTRLEGSPYVPFVTKCWLALVKEGLWNSTEVLVDGSLKVIIALDGRKRVGCLTWHEDVTDAATINLAYVVHSHRRKGVYREMQEELVRLAKQKGLKKIITITKPTNTAVRTAKEASGFKLVSVQYELDLTQ